MFMSVLFFIWFTSLSCVLCSCLCFCLLAGWFVTSAMHYVCLCENLNKSAKKKFEYKSSSSSSNKNEKISWKEVYKKCVHTVKKHQHTVQNRNVCHWIKWSRYRNMKGMIERSTELERETNRRDRWNEKENGWEGEGASREIVSPLHRYGTHTHTCQLLLSSNIYLIGVRRTFFFVLFMIYLNFFSYLHSFDFPILSVFIFGLSHSPFVWKMFWLRL